MTDLEQAFQILGVSPSDDAKTIRRAWRALLREYRPETARRDPLVARKKLADINAAFEAVCAVENGRLEELRVLIVERERLRERHLHDAVHRLKMARASERKRVHKIHKTRSASVPSRQFLPKKLAIGHKSDACDTALSVTQRAEKGFLEAMDVCSVLNFINVRSSYV